MASSAMRRIKSQTKAEVSLEVLKKNDSIMGHDYIEDSDVTSQVRAEIAFNILARAEHNLQTLVEIGKEFLSANRLIPGEDTKEVYNHMDKEWVTIRIPTLVHQFLSLESFRVMQGKSVEEKMRSDGYRLLRADFHKELTGKALPLISAEGVSPQTRALLAMTILEKELEAPVHNDVATRSVNLISDDGVDPETSALLAQSILEANVEASLYILASGKSVRFINNLSVTPKTWKILALSLLKRRNILDPYLCFTVERWVNTFNRKPESEKFIEGLQREYLQRFA